MKLVKTLTIVAVTGLVGLTALQACPGGCGDRGGDKSCKGMKQQRGQMKGVFKQLDLTSAQRDEMQALRKEMKSQREAHRSAKKGNRMAKMGQFVSAEGFDKAAFTTMATQKSQERIKMRADMFEKRMNILTPEQRTKFSELLQEK